MIQYFVFIGAFVQLVGTIIYIKKIVKGDVKPNKVTWFLWFLAPSIGVSAALSKGVGLSVVPVFMSGFGPLLIFIASFVNKNSYYKIGQFDYFCGFFSIVALFFWWITKDPAIAIAFALMSDIFAAIPTLIKSLKYPQTESVEVYFAGLFNSLTCFSAIRVWNFVELAFPIYLVLVNLLSIIFILRATSKNNK